MGFLQSVLNSIEPLAQTLAKMHQLSVVIFDHTGKTLSQSGQQSILNDNICSRQLCEEAATNKLRAFDRIIDGCYISVRKIFDNSQVMTMIVCMSRTPDSALSDQSQNELLESMTKALQSCLQWAGTQRSTVVELMEKYEELTLLYDISERLEGLPSFDEVANQMLKEAIARVKCRAGRLVVMEEDGNYHERISLSQTQNLLVSPADLLYKGADDTASICLSRPMAQIINDPTVGNEELSLTKLHVPISLKNTPIGVLSLFRQLSSPFKSSDKKIAEMLARQAAGKIESSRLYAKLENLFMESIKMLVECIDARDSYTSGHSTRVSIYSVFLAKLIGLPDDQVKTIEIGALLHDVGKIRIRDNVLNKPGRLDPEEREIIMKHPEFGMRVIEHVKQLHNTVPCIYCHHEFYNGKGYPRGLVGEEIPLMGRIVTVADTFDAMTSTRPYRKALSQQEAYEEIMRFRNIQFDPELAEVFGDAILRGEFSKYIETTDALDMTQKA